MHRPIVSVSGFFFLNSLKINISNEPAIVSDIYPMFIEPTITWVLSGFSGYIWLDTKIVLKNLVFPRVN